ncbi:hypothetical protein [Flexibacterium corallicola]|uniref:hypothetical protein n=1 Tax=Flexibacterium corallicola TaxID=3037259 RepID=UPI00286EE4C9|nr:hypothetical protein [Pseudovibrio sp. M1P-2-3]
MSFEVILLALQLITGMEQTKNIDIVVTTRTHDTLDFWQQASNGLCSKTNEFCNIADVQFLKGHSEPMGVAWTMDYTSGKRACVIAPPSDQINGEYVANQMGNSSLPMNLRAPLHDVQAWLLLYHAAHCLDEGVSEPEKAFASTFATLAHGLISGEATFTIGGKYRSEWRKMAYASGYESAQTAADYIERMYLDRWKGEVHRELSRSCRTSVIHSKNMKLETMKRDDRLPEGSDCVADAGGPGRPATVAKGMIKDSNLWLWLKKVEGNVKTVEPHQYQSYFGEPTASVDALLDLTQRMQR